MDGKPLQPTLLNGEPVEIDTTITVSFKLLPRRELREIRGALPILEGKRFVSAGLYTA